LKGGPLVRKQKNYDRGRNFPRLFMGSAKSAEITILVKAWSDGDKPPLDRLTPLIYDELRNLAHRYMRHERAGHTLQTTVVNEAYLRLVDVNRVDWQDRARGIGRGARSRANLARGPELRAGDSAPSGRQRAADRAACDRAASARSRCGAARRRTRAATARRFRRGIAPLTESHAKGTSCC
jgi:ECF sigma factor